MIIYKGYRAICVVNIQAAKNMLYKAMWGQMRQLLRKFDQLAFTQLLLACHLTATV